MLFALLQPIYLNLKIRHRSGNDDPTDGDDQILDFEPTLPLDASPARVPGVTQVISINGEQVETASLEHINIHDFTIFENHEILGDTFMDTIKRRQQSGVATSGGGIHKPGRSFKNVARTVLRSENFIEAIKKHYSHRSDSEPDSEEDEKQPAMGIAAAATVSLVGALIGKGDAPGKDAAAAHSSSENNEEDSLNTNMNNSSVSPQDVFIEDGDLALSGALPLNDAQVSEVSPSGKGALDPGPTSGSCHLAKGSGASTDKSLPLPLQQPPVAVSSSSRRARECGCCKVQ